VSGHRNHELFHYFQHSTFCHNRDTCISFYLYNESTAVVKCNIQIIKKIMPPRHVHCAQLIYAILSGENLSRFLSQQYWQTCYLALPRGWIFNLLCYGIFCVHSFDNLDCSIHNLHKDNTH